MALTDTAIRNARPGAKPVKLSDEKGLFLLVQPSGGKLWRLKYRVDGREKKLSLGRYPEVSLREARQRRDEARAQLANGIDPGVARRADAAVEAAATRDTFESLAAEYLSREERKGRAPVTMDKARWMLTLVPDLADRSITAIKPAELLAALRKIEARGHRETARRMLSLAARVFRFAIQESRAELDITPSLRGALLPSRSSSRWQPRASARRRPRSFAASSSDWFLSPRQRAGEVATV